MRKRIALLAALSLSPLALAGTMAEVTQVYFSPDGRYVLAVSHSQSDAAETDGNELRVLDTTTGREVWKAASKLPQQWPALQKKYGFRQPSKPRYRRPLPALAPSEVGPIAAVVGQTVVYPVRLWSKVAAVQLKATPAKRPAVNCQPWGVKPADYALSVNGQALTGVQSRPDCAFAYSLARADVQGNRALFVLNAFTPMTGGPDFNLVFVAATLK